MLLHHVFYHLIQLLKWLALFMQSPQLHFLSADGQIIMISHVILFICFQPHLLDVHALHYYPSLQGFNLFIQINQS
jgi:hypothetical protein